MANISCLFSAACLCCIYIYAYMHIHICAATFILTDHISNCTSFTFCKQAQHRLSKSSFSWNSTDCAYRAEKSGRILSPPSVAAVLNIVSNPYLSVFILIVTCTHKIPEQKGTNKSLKAVHHLFFSHSVLLLNSYLPYKLKFHQLSSARMINFSFPFSLCPHKKKKYPNEHFILPIKLTSHILYNNLCTVAGLCLNILEFYMISNLDEILWTLKGLY